MVSIASYAKHLIGIQELGSKPELWRKDRQLEQKQYINHILET